MTNRPLPTYSTENAPLSHNVNLYFLQRLVRFLARDGRTYYGDAILPNGVTDIARTKQARVIKGDIFGKHDVTDQIAVHMTLHPLSPFHWITQETRAEN